ncbi:DUF4129 domain-containing protein [Bacillus sp. FJAT-49705]|uniref:DUF4129 domain-containing protein n=1 Tax=Cytobacillus citreus TaxID=2833586 RepID=A0ABS5NQW9_9BACI|nr:DUF4129 domain-containing protein [Cytobacillus citreus]MBS4189528.1 DUF4129 domain-containing protein [Cytobacillus citreus]
MINSSNARDEIQKILNDKEYKVYYNESKNALELWWENAKEWIADQLAKLFPSITPSNGTAGFILIIIIVAVIALLGIIVFFLVRNQYRNRLLREKNPLQSMKEMDWSYQKHLMEANKLGALEEYTLSTRHLFLALLLYFHDKGWLEARIWKTNWEYYDELRKENQKWADQFFNLALLFDEAAYGEREIKKEEYLAFRTEAMKWLNEAVERTEG